MIGTRAFQRTFYRPADMVGTAVDSGRLFFLNTEPELGSDLHLIPERGESLANLLFAGIRAIDLRRIEKGDAFIVCPANQSYHIKINYGVCALYLKDTYCGNIPWR